MDDLQNDIARGCLENGEPIESRWGTGWWSIQPEPEPEYYGGECPFCGQEAWYYEGEFCDCPKCGKTYKDESER
jgi:hypothetical protein